MSSDLYHVIADPTRRQLLTELGAGERSVGDLVESAGVSQPTVSKHLRVLREAGLVSIRAQGQRRYYSLDAEPLREVLEWISGLLPLEASPAEELGEWASAQAIEAHERAAERRQHSGVGRTMEQVTGRAQEIIDRFAKQRFGRKR